jgi:hypothetical protein
VDWVCVQSGVVGVCLLEIKLATGVSILNTGPLGLEFVCLYSSYKLYLILSSFGSSNHSLNILQLCFTYY